MTNPYLLYHQSIEFFTHHVEEIQEASNNDPILFTVTKLGNDEVVINLQLENSHELTADQLGRSTNVTPQQLQNIMEGLLGGYCLYKNEVG